MWIVVFLFFVVVVVLLGIGAILSIHDGDKQRAAAQARRVRYNTARRN
jgi:hypothetical protein